MFENKQWPSDFFYTDRWAITEHESAVGLFIGTGSITDTERGFLPERNLQESVDGLGSGVKRAVSRVNVTWSAVLSSFTWQHSEETHQAVTRSFLPRVHLCIEEGGCLLNDIVHKKWNYVKSLTLSLLTCRIGWANNARMWQMGFNLAFNLLAPELFFLKFCTTCI